MEEGAERHWHEVLVVEDEHDVRDAISNLLHFQAFTVRAASDGDQAVAHLRDGYRPCVILLDLTMPGMDGASFRGRQRQMPDCADIPVIVVSGRDDGLEVSVSLGACAFLKKPVRIPALLGALQSHCRQSRSQA